MIGEAITFFLRNLPAFLFVMEVSLPLAVDRRVAAGDSDGKAKSKTTCATGAAVENQRPRISPGFQSCDGTASPLE